MYCNAEITLLHIYSIIFIYILQVVETYSQFFFYKNVKTFHKHLAVEESCFSTSMEKT